MKNYLVIIILVIIVVGGIIYFAIKSDSEDDNSNRSVEISEEAKARSEGAAWAKGKLDSEVVLTEYSDFQCPACAGWFDLLSMMLIDYLDQIKFEYRHFPLSYHEKAEMAAQAAEAAGRQGKFFEMHDLLFSNQDDWTESYGFENILKGYAEDLELDVDQFLKDLKDKDILKIIDADKQKAIDLNLQGTPSLLLNNELIEPGSEEEFRALLDEAIDSKNREADNSNDESVEVESE